ncbi:MAG: tetratricopeptide repeat protein [Gemmatales bacterium]|nr:tetratricopeptide repeat protein [Gemmatales bacterium]MDW8386277.1 tetratricopeptide repeat protein [Gemmatales bacterium]
MTQRWLRTGVCSACLLLGVDVAEAQIRFGRDLEIDPPKVAAVNPGTPAQQNHFKALKLFVKARILEQENRLVEAIRLYEDALKHDPDAVPLYKALIPLCFALDRDSQALDYCRMVLEKEPDNLALAYRYASELNDRGRSDEALSVLKPRAGHATLKDNPVLSAQINFLLAELHEDRQEHLEAAEALQRVVAALEKAQPVNMLAIPLPQQQIQEELARTYEKLGRLELLAKRYDRAIAAFEKAQEKNPNQAGRLHFHLAEVHLARDDPNAALASLQKYLATQPGGAEAYQLLVTLLTRLNRQREIVPTLEQAAARDPYNQALKMLLASECVRAGDFRKAESLYLASMAEYPSEDAYRGLARLYQKQSRWAELIRKLDQDFSDPRHLPSARIQIQVLSTEPELLKGLASAARNMPRGGESLRFETRRVLATLSRQHKFYDLAEHFCRKCLVDDPHPGEVYLELCRVLSEAQKWEAEAEVCREALTRNLRVPRIVFQLELARALALAGKDKEAQAAARIAMQQATPGTDEVFQAHYTLIVALYRGQHLEQAAQEAEKLLQNTADSRGLRQVHYLLSVIHSARKDYPRAETHLQRVLEIDPEDATACNDLGYLWADQGKNLEEAEKLIRKAIELDRANRRKLHGSLDQRLEEGDNAAYVDSLGWVLYRRGRLEEARQELERAVRLMTDDDPVIWDHLGEVYHDLGRRDQAKVAWEKAVQLYEKSRRRDPERVQTLLGKLKVLKATAAGSKP